MLDRLIDLIVNFIDLFKFWEVIDEYELGVVLRLGRKNRILDPGFHWKYPFGIERVLSDVVVPATINLGPQSLTTKDGKSVVVAAVVTFKTKDVAKLLLEVESANNVLEDSSYGYVSRYVLEHTWDELTTVGAQDDLTKQVRRNAKVWGIDVITVAFSDISLSRSYRIFSEGPTKFTNL